MLFTGSQKAFGVAPGLFMLWADEKALARRKSLGTIPEYYCDYENWIPIMDDPSKYFATPAVNLVWALKESVRIMKEEGMDARYARHIRTAKAMQKAFEAIGFTILAKEEVRAHTLSNLLYPAGIDDAAYRTELAKQGVQAAGAWGNTPVECSVSAIWEISTSTPAQLPFPPWNAHCVPWDRTCSPVAVPVPLQKNGTHSRIQKIRDRTDPGFGGQYWTRTSDLFDVSEALYRLS